MAGNESRSGPRKDGRASKRCKVRQQPARHEQAGAAEVPNLSSPQNDIVTVVVGKGEHKEKFTVYKKFICHYWPFFKAALDSLEGLFVENESQTGLCEQGWFGCSGSIREISYVYKHTKAGSPLRQLLIDQIACKAPYTALVEALTSQLQDFPSEMLLDLVLAQKKLLSKTKVAAKSLRAEDYFIMDVRDS